MVSRRQVRDAYAANLIDQLNIWCFSNQKNVIDWLERRIPKHTFYRTIVTKRLFGLVFTNPDFPVKKLPNFVSFVNEFLQTNYPLLRMNKKIFIDSTKITNVNILDKGLWLAQFDPSISLNFDLPLINIDLLWELNICQTVFVYALECKFAQFSQLRPLPRGYRLSHRCYDVVIEQRSKKKMDWLSQYSNPTIEQMFNLIDLGMMDIERIFNPSHKFDYYLSRRLPCPGDLLKQLSRNDIRYRAIFYGCTVLLDTLSDDEFTQYDYKRNDKMIDYLARRINKNHLINFDNLFFLACLPYATDEQKNEALYSMLKSKFIYRPKYETLLPVINWKSWDQKYAIVTRQSGHRSYPAYVTIVQENMSAELLLKMMRNGLTPEIINKFANDTVKHMFDNDPDIRAFRSIYYPDGEPIDVILPYCHLLTTEDKLKLKTLLLIQRQNNNLLAPIPIEILCKFIQV